MNVAGLVTVRWAPQSLAVEPQPVGSLLGGDELLRWYRPVDDASPPFLLWQPPAGWLSDGDLRACLASLLPGPMQATRYRHRIGAPAARLLQREGPVTVFGVDLVAGADHDAWNAYYDDEHFATVLTYDGYEAGARWVLEQRLVEDLDDPDRHYIVIYALADRHTLSLTEPATMPDRVRREIDRWTREGAPVTCNPLRLRGLPITR